MSFHKIAVTQPLYSAHGYLYYVSMKIPGGHLLPVNVLHVLNDGFQASLALLLPFIAAAQGLTFTQVGSLGTILNVAGVVLALPAGYIAARFGGLRTLLTALVIYALAFLGAGLLDGYYLLLVMFLLAGTGFGVFHPIAFALIAKWTPKERRGRTIGNFTAIGDLGRIGISAAVSFVVVAIGWEKTAMLYGIVALGMGFAIHLFVSKSETVPVKEQKPVDMTLWQIIKNKRLAFALSANGLDAFASSSLYIFLPFLLLQRGVSPTFLGIFTATFFIGNMFGKVVLGRLVDLFGNVRVFIASELLMAGCIFLLANSTALWLVVGCSIVLGIFTKGTVPVLQTMTSESVEHHGNYEKAFGLGAMITGATSMLAPILLGAISDKVSITAAFNAMAIVALLAVVPAMGYSLVRPVKTA